MGKRFKREKMKTRKFGWVRDHPDMRDKKYEIPKKLKFVKLPLAVNLTNKCPAIWDQGQLGSCTAFAIAGAVEFFFHSRDVDGAVFWIAFAGLRVII